MASKTVYSVVAVAGIAAASGAAYWYQHRDSGPREVTGAAAASAPGGSSPAAGAPGGAGARPGGGLVGVEVAKAEGMRLQDDAQAVGSLRSRQNVMLRPEVSGRIQSLGFSDGARVRKGQVLVQMEDTLQRAEIRQADAQVSIARANLKRNQELVAQNFVAQRVVDESSAQLQVQEAQLSLACARWERMRVVAPFDGTVGIRNVSIGDYVKDGADLVNLEDLSSMYVDFRLPERFIGRLRREQSIELQLDAMPGRLFKAKIEAIDPQIDANGRSVAVRAVLPNTAGEAMTPRGGAGGPGGPGGPGAASGGAGAGGVRASGIPGAAGKPAGQAGAASQAPRLPQRSAGPEGAGAAGAPARPADPIAASCAMFSTGGRAAGVVAGGAATGAAAGMRPGGAAPSGARSAGGPPGEVAAGSPVRTAAAAAGGGAGARPGAGAAGAGGGPLRPGMFARVTAVFNVKDNAVTVPEEALVPQGGRQFVFKLVEQTQAQARALAEAQAAQAAAPASAPAATAGGAGPGAGAGASQPYPMTGFVDGKRLVSQRIEVKTGIRRPGRVEITEGLADGDTVVIAGQQRLQRDNTPVRVVELGRPPGAAPAASPAAAGGSVGMGSPTSAVAPAAVNPSSR